MTARRRLWGAEPDGRGGVSFRVYAPDRAAVDVVVGDGAGARLVPLARDDAPGAWSGVVPHLSAGATYRYRLEGETEPLPDPASRFQPSGPEGPSQVVDPTFAWTDAAWRGIPRRGRVVYELHVGTFTKEGTWEAARARLPDLARLGVTVVEVMPVASFVGERGWGYDGVLWWAPHHVYGRPDEFRRFVDDAHRLGMGVILDVVYNHMGSIGNVLPRYSPEYQRAGGTEWGDGINFDEGARPARRLVTENVAMWIDEYHLDGFRFDATQTIFDSSQPHILVDALATARNAAGGRALYFVAENEPQDATIARPVEAGGLGLDALWNDDFHHTARVALTGHRDGYFVDYSGRARELAACVRHGFLFQGQRYRWQKKARGRSTRGLPPRSFVVCLENHDQIANYGLGARTWTRVAPGRLRALTALMLLAPATPMLFQGQEWNATASFTYFAEPGSQIEASVKAGRAQFLQQFLRYAAPDARDRFPDPASPETFAACRLDWDEREAPVHARAFALHRDLLELRRTDPTLAREGEGDVEVDAVAVSDTLLVVRYFDDADARGLGDRLLLLNLGVDREPASLSEPLVAPPHGTRWHLAWSSDDPRYGGPGVRGPREDHDLFFPGEGAVLLAARREDT
ncbi:MAG TPA: malto-oligosyltrehalose trehalohydrolase [Polyangia bacterium]|nr:malto-oligosyltrehalose trehalohydrolase [Polyangia bacterium]